MELELSSRATAAVEETYLIINYALDQHHAPSDNQRLNGVGKGVCLVRPGYVGGGNE